jgi:hypothetical protein
MTYKCSILMFFLLPALACGPAFAGLADFADGITEAKNWTAGKDAVGIWYGMDYSVTKSGYATLDFAGEFSNGNGRDNSSGFGLLKPTQDGQRSLLLAFPVPQAGEYNWQLDNLLTEYKQQYSYWQVHLVKDGTTIDLGGGPGWGYVPDGGKRLEGDFAHSFEDGDVWHSYKSQFKLSSQNVSKYDYITFTLTGSRHSGESLCFDNFSTSVPCMVDVPEPAALALLIIGGVPLLFSRCRRVMSN